ncbi:MAG: asparagine synthetase B, partial [Deltaproteobacteria bacterium]|nr:asparagine synthetase B [Deltaproteobacteria bacterium]
MVWIPGQARDDKVAVTPALSRGPDDASQVYELFQRKGPTCLEKLVGDFAFAIWDPQKETLFAARD